LALSKADETPVVVSTTTATSPEKPGKHTLEIEFPLYWEPQENDHKLFLVTVDSLEYNSIVDRFHETVPHGKIKKIQRNQNRCVFNKEKIKCVLRRLWMWYLLKKQDIAKKCGNANEKFLFHGSRRDAYDIILREGLDHRVAELGGAIGMFFLV
jgi:hypothetical protein